MKLFAYSIAALLLLSIAAYAFAGNGNGNDDRGPLTKITFIHYKNGNAKGGGGHGGGGNDTSSCYAFLVSGAKWKTHEQYAINPTNGDGVNASDVVNANNAGVAAWEAQAGDIFGSSYVDYSAHYNDAAADGVNTISFGNYPNSGVIAITNVWGYFSGPPNKREITEFDLLYNDQYFTWGDANADPSVMDVQNIATHELGHAFGMNDLYMTSCSTQTMYGYSSEGEVSKRTLESGDITGIKKLYG